MCAMSIHVVMFIFVSFFKNIQSEPRYRPKIIKIWALFWVLCCQYL